MVLRKTYHTAEWSKSFLSPEEKLKYQILQEKYRKLFSTTIYTPEKPEKDLKEEDDIKIPFLLNNKNEESEELSEKQKKVIRDSYENKKLVNKGYCFVTYASTDQAKLTLLRLNRIRGTYELDSPLVATLKEDLEPYELDNDFIFNILKIMKEKYLNYLSEVKTRGDKYLQEKLEQKESISSRNKPETKNKDEEKVEEIMEKELFNELENTTIGSLKPSEKYDPTSVGRQASLEIMPKDIERLRRTLDDTVDKKVKEWKNQIQNPDKTLSDYISPLYNDKTVKEIEDVIFKNVEELYSTEISRSQKEEVFMYILQKTEEILSESQPNLDMTDTFKLFGLNKENYMKYIEKSPKKWLALTQNPIVIPEVQDEKKIVKNQEKTLYKLLKDTKRRERFIQFIKHLQMLMFGKYDANALSVFNNQGVPLDQPELLINQSKDILGNDYLPFEEKGRILEYLRPENEEEKLQILNYEEQKNKLWNEIPEKKKLEIIENTKFNFPIQTLYEHEVGFSEKVFKPNLKPDEKVEDLVKKLNKEAPIGVEYIALNENETGDLVIKVIKPAYRVNIGKFEKLNMEKLKKMAEDQLVKKEGPKTQRKLDNKFSQMFKEIGKGKGVFSDAELSTKEMKKTIETLMKETNFSRAGK